MKYVIRETSVGKMSIWGDVIWETVRREKVRWGNVRRGTVLKPVT